MSFNLSESLTIIYFLFFFPQALPTADPAHLLWRGCNGSALCRCWLNMEGKPSLYQTLILSTGEKSCSPPTSLVWYLSFNKESTSLWYHYTKKQTSVKTSALYGWMKGTPSPSSDRTFVWKQILPELNIEGIKRDCMDICYQIVLNCGSDNHVFFFCTYIYTGAPDVPAQHKRYYWTFFFKMYSTLLLLLCIFCFWCSCCIFIGNETSAIQRYQMCTTKSFCFVKN